MLTFGVAAGAAVATAWAEKGNAAADEGNAMANTVEGAAATLVSSTQVAGGGEARS